jgi:hypothetical protein
LRSSGSPSPRNCPKAAGRREHLLEAKLTGLLRPVSSKRLCIVRPRICTRTLDETIQQGSSIVKPRATPATTAPQSAVRSLLLERQGRQLISMQMELFPEFQEPAPSKKQARRGEKVIYSSPRVKTADKSHEDAATAQTPGTRFQALDRAQLESMLSETSPSGEGLRNAATLLGSSREAIRGQNPHWSRNRIERERGHLVSRAWSQ